MRVARWVGAVWTSPNTAAGLLLGAAGWMRGANLSVEQGALVFHCFPWGPGGALVLGQVILHTGTTLDVGCATYATRGRVDAERICLADHERAHVLQYLTLGPLFLPLYLLSGGISARNRFERAADRYALSGRGWWPWPSD